MMTNAVLKKPRAMLDAGHYGNYNRSPVVPEYWESRAMWKLYIYLRAELEAYGFEVEGTRSDIEKDYPLYNRGYLAKNYDIFISLHSNACDTETVDRVDVYAAYDNRNNSHELAARLAGAVAELMQVSGGYVKTRKGANENEYYGVLRGARNAGCPLFYIIEHSFHTNKAAAQWLLVDNNLKRLAALEAAIIAEYFGIKTKYTIGDVDGDGDVDALDYILIKRAVMGTFTMTEEQGERADIDHDGEITSLDYILAKRIVFGTYTPKDKPMLDSAKNTFSIGDKVKINTGVKTYADGDPISDWVYDTTLYVRDIESDGKILLVSKEKTKEEYTGRMNANDVHKI